MKSLFLASAAGVSFVSLAQAADVPMDKAEAVEYVKVCSEFGTGFFYIPGTDTCLQISGYVQADAYYKSTDYKYTDTYREQYNYSESADSFVMRSEAQVNFDARTATAYGILRSFISIRGNHVDGAATNFEMHNAYLQLGGFAAGFNTSAFAYFDNTAPTVLENYYSSDARTNFFSYTATFDGGFFATASVESRQARDANYEGEVADTSMPDLVGVIGVKQTWGDVQLMGAAHQAYDPTTFDSAKTGYAVGAGATINLGMSGAKLMIEGIYADGAISYLGGNSFNDYNYFFDISSNRKSTTGYSLNSSFSFDVSPALNLAVTGAYQHLGGADIGYNDGTDTSAYKNDSAKLEAYSIGGTATYTVIEGFTVAASVAYVNNDFTAKWTNPTSQTYTASDESWSAGIRVEREF